MSTLCQRQVGRLGPFYNIRIYQITINLQDSAISMTAIVIKSAYFGDLAEANVSSWFQRKSLTLFHTTGHTVNVPVYYVWVIDWVKLRYCRTVHEASEDAEPDQCREDSAHKNSWWHFWTERDAAGERSELSQEQKMGFRADQAERWESWVLEHTPDDRWQVAMGPYLNYKFITLWVQMRELYFSLI